MKTKERLLALMDELKIEKTRFDSIAQSDKEPRSYAIASKIIKLEKEIEEINANLNAADPS